MELYDKVKLLFTRLTGIATSGEEEEFDRMLAEHPAMKKLYTELSNPENYEERENFLRRIDPSEEWKSFEKRRTHRTLRQLWYRRAAVIALPLLMGGICAWLLLSPKTPDVTESVVAEQIIPPGSKGATLILSNGTQLQLTPGGNHITEQDGSRIQSDSAQLDYRASQIGTEQTLQNRLVIGRGFEYMLVLSDGTKVWMNSESTLQYPVKFSGSAPRKVQLTGEAYFEVTRDTACPFIVEVNESYAVKVLGTSFNINAYMNNRNSETTLVTGSIEVTDYRTQQQYTLTPDKQIIVSPEGCLIRKVNTANYIAWHEGFFYFDNQKLDRVLEMLGRWYDVEIRFESDYLKSIMVTGKLKRFDNLQTILQMLAATTGRKFEINNKIIYIKEEK